MIVATSRWQKAGSLFGMQPYGGLGAGKGGDGEGEGGCGEAVGGCIGGVDPALAPLRSNRNMQSLSVS